MTADNDHAARILDEGDDADRALLDRLRADPRVDVIDAVAEQQRTLAEVRPTPGAEVLEERTKWAYYPWRRTLVGILGPQGFRALRLDRNRNLITAVEQRRLETLTIAVAGLSVGHVIAHTLAMQGMCATLRLADFDTLELSNLNRVPATVLDLGINKAIVAARRIAELNPYLGVEVVSAGVTAETLDGFLDGVDVVVEECDSLDMKLTIREAARGRRLPVVMATSDRGLVDVERFDLDPTRPVLHGALGSITAAQLADLPREDKVPYVLRHVDATQSSTRMTASLVEVGHTLSTWPQLAGEVTLGAAAVVEAVRRITLGEPLDSGQVRIDIAATFDQLDGALREYQPPPVVPDDPVPANSSPATELVAEAARRAPSGGNAQPWTISLSDTDLTIRVAPERTSMMDAGFRGSAVAVGAALFNARVAAAARGVLGEVVVSTTDAGSPLTATLRLGSGTSPDLAAYYEPMLLRETNRRRGTVAPVDEGLIADLTEAAAREGGRLAVLTARGDVEELAQVCAAADRIRYLTPPLHRELVSELRWPGEGAADSGIDVMSLELAPADIAVLDILRRPDVMAALADWDGGAALGEDVAKRVRSSSALALVTVRGGALPDYVRGGAAMEAVWIEAQRRGLAVQPVSPVFLHAVGDAELWKMSPRYADDLRSLQARLREVAGTQPDEALVLLLRLSHAAPASVRSRRRRLV
ncbi:Rv1355c family protein [Mycobacterium sp. MYCO198283]|uniref:Rv1355c family protein n=1 Tax=Mycobacterium sp. MYCO198283 TaxID=2883505 RepID=UPI001E30E9FD|nr:Rv1355c family protein [Mycobacterium sp. MYCO198283]MCG5434328.1 Rv1355c family protein [Mycobacterium sp. MYCO198283]